MRPNHRRPDGGYVLLALLFSAAAVLVVLARSLPRDAMRAQRSREEVLIYRGEQYKRAIQLYFREHKKYPEDLDDLEDTDGVRYLRRRYKDPLTDQDEWRLIHMGPQGRFTDSLIYDTEEMEEDGFGSGPSSAQNFGQSGAGFGGQSGFGRQSAFGSNSGSGFGSRQGSGFGSRNSGGFGSSNSQSSFGSRNRSGGFGSRNRSGGFGSRSNSRSNRSTRGQTYPQQQLDPYNQATPNRALTQRESAAPNPFQQAQAGAGIPGLAAAGGVAPADPNQPVQLGPDGQPIPPQQDYSQTRPTQVPLRAGERLPPNSNAPGGIAGMPGYQQQYGGAAAGVQPGQAGVQPGAPPFPTPAQLAQAGGPGTQPGVGNQAANIIQRLLTTPRPGGLAGITSGANQAMQAGGGLNQFSEGIAGVASTFEGSGVKVYKGYEQYQEWEFVFDYREDGMTAGLMGGGMGLPGNMNPGQPGIGPGGTLSGNPGAGIGGLGSGSSAPSRSRAGQQGGLGQRSVPTATPSPTYPGTQPYQPQGNPNNPAYPGFPGGLPTAGQAPARPNPTTTPGANPQPELGVGSVAPRPASPYSGIQQPTQPSSNSPGRSLTPSRFGSIQRSTPQQQQ